MVVVLVLAEMPRQILDAARQQGDLHFRRACVALVDLILFDDLRFVLSLQWHAFRLRAPSNFSRVGWAPAPSFWCAMRAHRDLRGTALTVSPASRRHTRRACPVPRAGVGMR